MIEAANQLATSVYGNVCTDLDFLQFLFQLYIYTYMQVTPECQTLYE